MIKEQKTPNDEILNIGNLIRTELIYGPIVVYGEPVTQGDHTIGFRRRGHRQAYIRHANGQRLDDWRNVVGTTFKCIQNKINQTVPLDGAVAVSLDFFYPHPQKHFTKTGKPSCDYTDFKTSPPDGDKLMRAVFDALTHIAYKDDANIAVGWFSKTFHNVPKPGVVIRVYRAFYNNNILAKPVPTE